MKVGIVILLMNHFSNQRIILRTLLNTFRKLNVDKSVLLCHNIENGTKEISPMEKTYNISEAAKILGVSVKTLQRWDRDKKLIANRTPSNRRFYTEKQICEILNVEENRMEVKRFGIYTLKDNEKEVDVVVVQNNVGNKKCDTTIVVPYNNGDFRVDMMTFTWKENLIKEIGILNEEEQKKITEELLRVF